MNVTPFNSPDGSLDEESTIALIHQIVAMSSHISRMQKVKEMSGHNATSMKVVDDVIDVCRLQLTALHADLRRTLSGRPDQLWTEACSPCRIRKTR